MKLLKKLTGCTEVLILTLGLKFLPAWSDRGTGGKMPITKANQHFLFRRLLGIITPEEINDLTTQYCGERRINLIDLASFDFMGIPVPIKMDVDDQEVVDTNESGGPELELSEGDGSAKILPFAPQDEETADFEHIRAGEECAKMLYFGLRSDGELNRIPKSAGPNFHDNIRVKEKKAASAFILQEKQRLEQSHKKLKEKEVLEVYKNVSSIQLHRDKKGRKSEKSETKKYSSSHCGVLVNKKSS